MQQDIRSILDRAREEDGAGNRAAALMNYRLFLKYEAGCPQAWADYAGCLIAAGRFEDSLAASGTALGLEPGMEPALINRAAALSGLKRLHVGGDMAAIEPGLLAGLDHDLDHDLGSGDGREDALGKLIAVCAAKRDWAGFREYSERLIDLKFEGEERLWQRSGLLLKLGDFGEGLGLFENRPSNRGPSGFKGALWGGGPFPGRTLLVHREQGFGDTIMMLRYGPMLKALGGRVVLHVQPELLDLARTCAGFDDVAPCPPCGPDAECDLHIPMMSLPLRLGTDLDSIPAEVPYLGVPPLVKNRAAIRERLARHGAQKRKVCLVWAGNAGYGNDYLRSIPADQLAPLGDYTGAAWFCLQREAPGVVPFAGAVPMGDLMETFADTAFLIDSMDAVVTADTSAAHLAGALGKPTRLMLPFMGEWRWMADRADSPWYPTGRIYRQPYDGDWREAAAAVAADLCADPRPRP
jgi:hypothetical protein